jgi:hypothetical protein
MVDVGRVSLCAVLSLFTFFQSRALAATVEEFYPVPLADVAVMAEKPSSAHLPLTKTMHASLVETRGIRRFAHEKLSSG